MNQRLCSNGVPYFQHRPYHMMSDAMMPAYAHSAVSQGFSVPYPISTPAGIVIRSSPSGMPMPVSISSMKTAKGP